LGVFREVWHGICTPGVVSTQRRRARRGGIGERQNNAAFTAEAQRLALSEVERDAEDGGGLGRRQATYRREGHPEDAGSRAGSGGGEAAGVAR